MIGDVRGLVCSSCGDSCQGLMDDVRGLDSRTYASGSMGAQVVCALITRWRYVRRGFWWLMNERE